MKKDLNFSEETRREICENTQIILHYGAITDFFKPLNVIISCNVNGGLRILDLAKSCKKLEVFLLVSTFACAIHLAKYINYQYTLFIILIVILMLKKKLFQMKEKRGKIIKMKLMKL